MSVLQKFEKFALTKEQGNVIKGGSYTCKYSRHGGGSTLRNYSNADYSAAGGCPKLDSSWSCSGCTLIPEQA